MNRTPLLRRLPRIAIACLPLLAAALSARADIIYDSFGPGDTFATTGGQSVGAFSCIGVQFMPTVNTTPATVTVAMKSTSGSTVMLSVRTEISGHAGTTLFSTTATIAAGTEPQVYTATFASPTELTGGTNYWLVASFVSGTQTWMPTPTTTAIGYAATASGCVFTSGPNTQPSPALRIEDAHTAPTTGACCTGSICAVTSLTACNAQGTHFAGTGTTCNAAGNNSTPCCFADFEQNGSVSVADIFAYLNAWFAGDPRTDIDGGGLAVTDIFAFLNAWFAGC